MDELEKKLRMHRSYKDTVFCDLFSDKENLLELYKSLNPEDTTCTTDDLNLISLRNVLLNGAYNDLGFMVRDQLIVLVEAQSTWSTTILFRVFLYLAYTCRELAAEKYGSIHKHSDLKLPPAKLYVVYTGDRKDIPELLSTRDLYLEEETDYYIRVRIIRWDNALGISHEYISFCKIVRDVVKVEGYTDKAIKQAIAICENQNILKKYLEKRKVEVARMLSDMFDQDAAFDAYIEAVKRELKDEYQRETKELKDEYQRETKELQDEHQRELREQNKKNREESISRHISFCIKHKMSQEEIIQSLVEDFELSREESNKRILEFVKVK